ncbi:3-ketoacyl-coa synthase 12 [Quercus suber]|uniref:3-ketoacyl-coa synthase 12 n=1 Tax=Quercus suber TaxID=58331 RepID=A0AAW0JF38_QUESU
MVRSQRETARGHHEWNLNRYDYTDETAGPVKSWTVETVERPAQPHLDDRMLDILLKNVVNSGIGEQTYAPRTIIAGREQNPTILDAISEMEEFFHDSIAKLLARTAISPLEIEVLVVNVSMLSLVPSLAARIINH